MTSLRVVVMGVSGCGKSLIGGRLADELEVPFFDADDFHSPANVAKMASGTPLTDADRSGWLSDLAALIRGHGSGLVLACSALKRDYRDRLRAGDARVRFVYLRGDIDTIWSRHASRTDHYFNGRAMLESQFQTLEEPEPESEPDVLVVDVREPPERIVDLCLQVLGAEAGIDGADP